MESNRVKTNRKVSVVFPLSYSDRGPNNKYAPLIEFLGDKVANVYGIKKTKSCQFEFQHDRKILTRIPSFIAWHIVANAQKVFRFPRYYVYLTNVFLFDVLFSSKVAKDESDIVFTTPLLKRTVEKSKKRGKTVVLEAGNSEPVREYERVATEYEKYKIQNKYIYGDPVYKDITSASLELAEHIISISNVSIQTYADRNYNMDKFKMIPLTGTDFPIQTEVNSGKKKVFITTAFHSFIKGTHRLLLAWKASGIKNIPLIVVGNICEDLQEFIDKYGPFENVVFTGQLTNLSEWYKSFDAVGVLLSLSEGAVRVTPEMMSFGFPMITTLDASCDIVQDGYNGFIVDVFNEKSIIDALSYFSQDWERVYKMRDNVVSSVSNRTVRTYSIEIGEFLADL